MNTIFSFQDNGDYDSIGITHKQIDEAQRRGTREGRLWALNNLTKYWRKELKKKEILTYARRNKIPIQYP